MVLQRAGAESADFRAGFQSLPTPTGPEQEARRAVHTHRALPPTGAARVAFYISEHPTIIIPRLRVGSRRET